LTGNHIQLLLQQTPILDVRAPEEFRRGHVLNATNLPLLDDNQRHQVGLCYRQEGQQAAIALGHRLIDRATRSQRLDRWQKYLASQPEAVLCCWRGGLRSEIAQQWLSQAGVDRPRVKGGYKALRQSALQVIEGFPQQQPCVVLAGRTGSGKTYLLKQFDNSIDLEGLANHRGSAFGARQGDQPSPASFENALAAAMLQQQDAPWLLLEDEGRTLGRLGLPLKLIATLKSSPVVVLERSLRERAAIIQQEYVAAPLLDHPDPIALRNRYLDALARIRRRLGGARQQQLARMICTAFETQEIERHYDWIEQLLSGYYDPMYDYQLKGKSDRVVFRGSPSEVNDYLRRL